jgi:hypothetical protein
MPAEVARDTGDRIETATTVKGQEKSLFHGLRKEEPFHMLLFAVGGGLGMACVITNRRRLLLLFTFVVLSVSAYGILIEIVQQRFIAGRSFQWSDVGSNSLGIVAGCLVFVLLYGLWRSGWTARPQASHAGG